MVPLYVIYQLTIHLNLVINLLIWEKRCNTFPRPTRESFHLTQDTDFKESTIALSSTNPTVSYMLYSTFLIV